MKIKLLILLTFCITSLTASDAFISPSGLKKIFKNKELVIIDVDSKALYTKGHIENAIHCDTSEFIQSSITTDPEQINALEINKYKIASKNKLENELRSLGINNDSKVVIYHHNTQNGFLNSSFLHNW